jgi:hypothetical protein
MADYLEYTGTRLIWHGRPTESFLATSGMVGSQSPNFQCRQDAGPVPEGTYYLKLTIDAAPYASEDDSGTCTLRPSPLIQKIPRGTQAGSCEPYWENWGWNRVRFEAADSKTADKCNGNRSGFYIHDSSKGFTHGCIETEQLFFARLLKYAQTSKGKTMPLKVKYSSASTYGGTKAASR